MKQLRLWERWNNKDNGISTNDHNALETTTKPWKTTPSSLQKKPQQLSHYIKRCTSDWQMDGRTDERACEQER